MLLVIVGGSASPTGNALVAPAKPHSVRLYCGRGNSAFAAGRFLGGAAAARLASIGEDLA